MAQTPDTGRPGAERTSTQSDFRLAVADSSVVMLGIAVLGLGLGIILNAHGLPIWTAPLLSALVFAGSVEFLMVGMVSGGTPLASIALTVFLVNARHLVYGLSYPLHSVKGFWAKALAVHTLCDEAFALNSGPDRNERSGGAHSVGERADLRVVGSECSPRVRAGRELPQRSEGCGFRDGGYLHGSCDGRLPR